METVVELASFATLIRRAALTVFLATLLGFPVPCGALPGIGLITAQADVGVIRQVVASWVLTLPLAALLAGVVSLVLG